MLDVSQLPAATGALDGVPLARSSSLPANFSRTAHPALEERAGKCLVLVSVRCSISPTWCGSMCLGSIPSSATKSLVHYRSLALVRHLPHPSALVPKGAAECAARHLLLDELLRLSRREPCSTPRYLCPLLPRALGNARITGLLGHPTEGSTAPKHPDLFACCTDEAPLPAEMRASTIAAQGRLPGAEVPCA